MPEIFDLKKDVHCLKYNIKKEQKSSAQFLTNLIIEIYFQFNISRKVDLGVFLQKMGCTLQAIKNEIEFEKIH